MQAAQRRARAIPPRRAPRAGPLAARPLPRAVSSRLESDARSPRPHRACARTRGPDGAAAASSLIAVEVKSDLSTCFVKRIRRLARHILEEGEVLIGELHEEVAPAAGLPLLPVV